MKIKYHKVNPGGNITAIVIGKFTKNKKIKIAREILKNELTIEQVGFWVRPKNRKSDARLEMAGGEFCGNALRCLGALLALQDRIRETFLVESSGTNDTLKVKVRRNKSVIEFPIEGIKYANNICELPGIIHFLTEDKFKKSGVKKQLKEKGLLTKQAAGVMSYEKEAYNKYRLTPTVWVNKARTLYEETACASGTIALSYMLYSKYKLKKIKIIQPSGACFDIEISGKIIKLSGPIVGVAKKEINLK